MAVALSGMSKPQGRVQSNNPCLLVHFIHCNSSINDNIHISFCSPSALVLISLQ